MSLEPASRATSEAADSARTGLPGIFHAWRTVYVFVVVIFFLVVAALAALPDFFA